MRRAMTSALVSVERIMAPEQGKKQDDEDKREAIKDAAARLG
jgi:hypothetical protein